MTLDIGFKSPNQWFPESFVLFYQFYWSNYKNTNTIKHFVACAPSGSTSFLSEDWGGRVSDKEITIKSGFLRLIEYGDQVLADHGFTVAEKVASKGGILITPSFTKGKSNCQQKR